MYGLITVYPAVSEEPKHRIVGVLHFLVVEVLLPMRKCVGGIAWMFFCSFTSNFEHCEQDCRLEPLKQQLTAQFHAESQLNSN